MKNKNILIIGASINSNDAVSNIIKKLLLCGDNSFTFYIFGYDRYKNEYNIEQSKSKPRIIDLSIPNPQLKLCYRVLDKMYRILHHDRDSITSMYAYYRLQRQCKGISFDLIVSLSGLFSFANISYKFSKKNNIPLRMVYFDPYVDNIYTNNYRKRKRKEIRWAKHSELVLYNCENHKPRYMEITKTIPFKIPIFEVPIEVLDKKTKSDYLVYGGSFYPKIRDPYGLFGLADKLEGCNTRIYCYSNFSHEPYKDILFFYSQLSSKEYEKKCINAKGLIYIGNIGGNSVSSKFLEYISYHKPIIGINVNNVDEVRRYPFYFDMSDNIGDKLRKIDSEKLIKYDAYVDYPDRRPEMLFAKMFM